MNILHVIPGLKNASGPTQSVFYLSKYQIEAGHQVTVAYISGRGTDPEFDFQLGVELLGFPCKYLSKWAYSPALKRYLVNNCTKYDIIHVHGLWLYPNLAVYQIAKKGNIPYIIRPAGSLEPWAIGSKSFKKKVYLRFIERRIINAASALHVTAEQEKENLKPFNFSAPIITVPNGIELSEYSNKKGVEKLKEKFQIPDNKFILLFLSRIHPKKNLEFLGRVLKKVVEKRENVLLLIAGPKNHTYGEKIQNYYESLGLRKYSRFIGEVNGAEKVNLYHAVNAFALTTFSENFGFVVLEALAAGLPVLVSDQTPWDVINEKNAGFWLPLNEEKFINVIIDLIDDMEMQNALSENALKIAENFDWSNICKTLELEYLKLRR